jgi:two-component system, cell cycle response regulator DivK
MQRPSVSTPQSPVVLLVQPSRDDGLEMYAEFLRYHGLAPITVSNVRNALMLAAEADIIVTGIILDDPIDGVELVSRLRHDDSTMHKPIIVLSACAYRRDRVRAEDAGCDVFLPKPCLPSDLLREVRRLLPATNCGNVSADWRKMACISDPSNSTARDERGWNRGAPLSCELAR